MSIEEAINRLQREVKQKGANVKELREQAQNAKEDIADLSDKVKKAD